VPDLHQSLLKQGRNRAQSLSGRSVPGTPRGYNGRMNAHHQSFDVAVIGGGLVGKTAALALTQSGLRVALLAQHCQPLPADAVFDSRVYALSASSQALLERLRVWQALDTSRLARGSPNRR
jgi:alkyl hydroperoxide reductase subunit AhpF